MCYSRAAGGSRCRLGQKHHQKVEGRGAAMLLRRNPVAEQGSRRAGPVVPEGVALATSFHSRVGNRESGCRRRRVKTEDEECPMNPEQLRTLQAPLKARYKDDPAAALITLKLVSPELKELKSKKVE